MKVVLALGAALILLTACGSAPVADVPPAPEAAPTSRATPLRRPSSSPEPPAGVDSQRLATGFETLAASYPGELALAVVPVGGGDPLVFGSVTEPVAWSTIKVPISIAALRNDTRGRLEPTMRAAITWSDNGSAMKLYSSLGRTAQAQNAVDQVLHDLGDPNTSLIKSSVNFGEATWELHDQARFAAQLPCHPDAQAVYEAMDDVIEEQSWGLGIFPGAHFKGGWGISDRGTLVRQLGVIETAKGNVAVAVAYDSDDSDVVGFVALTEVAQWLAANADALPVGQCPGATPRPEAATTAPLRTWTPEPTIEEPEPATTAPRSTRSTTRPSSSKPSTRKPATPTRRATAQPSARSTKG
ncbi:hypothetical protein AADG42_00295 [Ammonicoccus fulvus]|uniref:Serine hydrolase n=1 Tax=Ammonicoccus fulvus TaxID=3138240 RepID=A0ABZ3FLU6_9ACTN